MLRLSLLCLLLTFGLATFCHAEGEAAVLDAYDSVSLALAADDLAAAKKSAAALATVAQTAQPAMATAATQIAESNSLPDARKAFKEASEEAVKLASGRPGYYVMTCPMVHADWVQKMSKINNPYMGKAMLECGVIKARP